MTNKTIKTDKEVEKEFEEKVYNGEFLTKTGTGHTVPDYSKLQDFILQTRTNDKKAIREMIEGMKKKITKSEPYCVCDEDYNRALQDIMNKLKL